MEATFIKFNKKFIFQTLSVEILSYGPLNSATHIFTRLERLSPFPTANELPGSVVQTKSRTTISWYGEHWPVTYLLILL